MTAGSALAVCALVASCGTAVTTEPSSAIPVATRGEFGGLIDVGNGRTMYLECSGTGSPTVVLIAGNLSAGDG